MKEKYFISKTSTELENILYCDIGRVQNNYLIILDCSYVFTYFKKNRLGETYFHIVDASRYWKKKNPTFIYLKKWLIQFVGKWKKGQIWRKIPLLFFKSIGPIVMCSSVVETWGLGAMQWSPSPQLLSDFQAFLRPCAQSKELHKFNVYSYTPILIWSFRKESAIWSILIRE